MTEAAQSDSIPTMISRTVAGNDTIGAQRGAVSGDGRTRSNGGDCVLVTRRYNSVLAEMQAKWAKEQNERLSENLSDNQTIDPRNSLDSLNGSREVVSVQESLTRLGNNCVLWYQIYTPGPTFKQKPAPYIFQRRQPKWYPNVGEMVLGLSVGLGRALMARSCPIYPAGAGSMGGPRLVLLPGWTKTDPQPSKHNNV